MVRGLRSAMGAVVAVAAVAVLPACDGFHRVCEKATLTVEPGRIVQLEGEPYLEVTARFMHGDKPVVGANLDFSFDWERSGLILAEVKTDATGAATYQRSLDDVADDVHDFGAFQGGSIVWWNNQFPVDGVTYCDARATGSLPLDQLPQPTVPPADSTP